MNANDLRVGNWILHNSDRCQVFSISQEWMRVKKDRNIAISYDNISGIQLTEEILLQIGFHKGYEKYQLGNIRLSPNHNNSYAIKFLGFYLTEISYVHQLQNFWFMLHDGNEFNVNF